jgi:hypothetical protein
MLHKRNEQKLWSYLTEHAEDEYLVSNLAVSMCIEQSECKKWYHYQETSFQKPIPIEEATQSLSKLQKVEAVCRGVKDCVNSVTERREGCYHSSPVSCSRYRAEKTQERESRFGKSLRAWEHRSTGRWKACRVGATSHPMHRQYPAMMSLNIITEWSRWFLCRMLETHQKS